MDHVFTSMVENMHARMHLVGLLGGFSYGVMRIRLWWDFNCRILQVDLQLLLKLADSVSHSLLRYIVVVPVLGGVAHLLDLQSRFSAGTGSSVAHLLDLQSRFSAGTGSSTAH